jgi:hypothetical protein
MRLGTDGTGTSQVDTAIIAGTNVTISGAAAAGTVNIATGAGAKVVTLGSTNGASSLALQFGTADFTIASSTGTVMSILDTGEVTMPLQPAFLAYKNAENNNVTGDGTSYNIVYDVEDFDNNADFDGVSTFTAPVTGKYFFTASVYIGGLLNTHLKAQFSIKTTGDVGSIKYIYSPWAFSSSDKRVCVSMTSFVKMTAGDTCLVDIIVYSGNKVVNVLATSGVNAFSGHLVC